MKFQNRFNKLREKFQPLCRDKERGNQQGFSRWKKQSGLRKSVWLGVALFLLFCGVVLWHPAKIVGAVQVAYNKWKLLTLILDKIERFYVEEKDPDEILDHAISGMLSSLDAHSVYLSPSEYAKWKEQYTGYYGIGLKYNFLHPALIVCSLVEGGPAERSGIKLGDKILSIQGTDVANLKNEEIRQLLIGPEGSNVIIEIQRNGFNDHLVFEVPREKIILESIPCYFMYNDQVGYIKIAYFSSTTPTELDIAVAKLQNENMSRLILDLRDNSGGEFNAGVEVADRFLSAGKIIVFTQGRFAQSNQQYISTNGSTYDDIPLIVLVNQATASDAEIVAGALQDWDRALIVGNRTYGKALVQTEYPFQDGSALLLTTARYFTPLGRLIQKDSGQADVAAGSLDRKETKIKLEVTPQKYVTPKGRIVYGGGGIAPDIYLEESALTMPEIIYELSRLNKNYILKFADRFVSANPKVTQDQTKFVFEYQVTDPVLEQFYVFLRNAGELQLEREARVSPAALKFALKREIAGRMWGDNGRFMISVLGDKDVRKSIEYFTQAENLISR
jgi:carboxyl-terminal processing protease